MIKKCLITFLSGFILAVAGLISIGSLLATGYLDESDISVSLPGSAEASYAETTYAVTDTANNDGGTYSYIEIPVEETEQVTSLDVSVGMGTLYICVGDVFSLSGNNITNKNVTYEITDGCFKLNCATDLNFKLLSLDFSNIDEPDLYMTVPAKVYDRVKVKISAGQFTADRIETNDLDFDISMGEAFFYDVCAKESAKIEMSMGECGFNGGILRNANIKMTAGDMTYENIMLSGNNNIKLTAGEIYMGIAGNRSDYSFNIDKTAGEVIIDGMEGNIDMVETSVISRVNDNENTATEVTVTETSVTVTGGEEYTVEEKTEEAAAETGGTINIDISAGECVIDFYGSNEISGNAYNEVYFYEQ